MKYKQVAKAYNGSSSLDVGKGPEAHPVLEDHRAPLTTVFTNVTNVVFQYCVTWCPSTH